MLPKVIRINSNRIILVKSFFPKINKRHEKKIEFI